MFLLLDSTNYDLRLLGAQIFAKCFLPFSQATYKINNIPLRIPIRIILSFRFPCVFIHADFYFHACLFPLPFIFPFQPPSLTNKLVRKKFHHFAHIFLFCTHHSHNHPNYETSYKAKFARLCRFLLIVSSDL